MKEKKKIFGMFFIVLVFLFIAYSGISPLFAKSHSMALESLSDSNAKAGRYVKGEVHFTSNKILEIKNSINLIPTGKEHYYLIFNEDGSECVVVRADKNWRKSFDSTGFSVDGVEVNGVLKKIDSDTKQDINDILQKMSDSGINPKVSSYYIDCLSDRYAIFTILSYLIMLVLFIGFRLVIRRIMGNSLLVEKILVVLFVLFLFDICFFIHIITMIK